MSSPILYVLACSNTKISGGTLVYDSDHIILNELTSSGRSYLSGLRSDIVSHIKLGGGTRQGKRLIEHLYNSEFVEKKCPDGKGILYMPAMCRYAGRLYTEITKKGWEERAHHAIIISGLYGLLLPEEPIQRYSVNLSDSSIISDTWKEWLTIILEEYIKRNGIKYIVDCTGENLYRNIIDWNHFKDMFEIYHIYGTQNTGPAILRAIGWFLGHEGLVSGEKKILDILRSRKEYPTDYEALRFIKNGSDVKKLGLPEEDVEPWFNELHKRVPASEIPKEIKDAELGKLSKFTMTYKVLCQWEELPGDVREMVPGKLHLFSTNPRHPSLGLEKEKTGKGFFRMRINKYYRMHVEITGDELIIRAIGPHRLEGIG